MTLLINAIFGFPARVELDLLTMLQGDMGFGDQPTIADPTVFEVTYKPTTSGTTQSRIQQLVNGVLPNQVVITGVDSSYGFVGPGGFYVYIKSIGGGACVVMKKDGPQCSGGVSNYGKELIAVVYDVSQCGGEGYWVRNMNNDKIDEPPIVALYHELSHAFHWANRTSEYCTTADKGEIQAVEDENTMRTQFSLPKRNPNNRQGGCGAPGTYGNPWESVCFIVSAAFDAPYSEQVREFQRLRDSLLRSTRLGHAVFATLADEYYQCAPRICSDMHADTHLKLMVARLVVEPLLEVLRLTEIDLNRDLRSPGMDDEIRHMFMQWRGRLEGIGVDAAQIRNAVEGISRFHDQLSNRVQAPDKQSVPPTGWTVQATFDYLATTILGGPFTTAALAWCLAEPLGCYWLTFAEFMVDPLDSGNVSDRLAGRIEAWLASAPIDWAAATADTEALAADVRLLRAHLITSNSMWQRFAAMVSAGCPGVLRPSLATAMDRADLLRSDG